MPTRPSFVSIINPIIPLIFLFWKRICVSIFLFILLIVLLSYTLVILPLQLSDAHEYEHFEKIDKDESKESIFRWSPSLRFPWEEDLPPMHERPTRLIKDVIQLTTTSYQGSMSLNFDGTAKYPMGAYWIYVAGTGRNASEPLWKRVWRRASFFSMPGGSCIDPPKMCDAYNEAYQQLIFDMRAKKFVPSGRGLERFIDCDNSPLLCDQLMVDPVMVIHVEVPEGACEFQLEPAVAWACDVKWSFYGLPLLELPFLRNVRLPDGRLVPVFPSEYEQLYQLIMLGEGIDAMKVKDPPHVEWFNVTDATREYMKSLKPSFNRRNPEDDDQSEVPIDRHGSEVRQSEDDSTALSDDESGSP